MAFQMVYTSVRSGLVAGRSGFCTAARHREIKESLVARLEDFSTQYDRGITAGGTLPVVYQHRIVTIRDQRHHVLMRLGDAGNDYTGRTNHIAHCLVVEPSEIARLSISPAEAILALSQRGFWRNHYDEPAQFFGAGDLIELGTLPRSASLPATRWRDRSGSSANAAQLFESGGPVDASLAVSGTGEADAAATLALFAESVLLLDPDRSSGTALWSVPFTTVLQSSAERSQFRWCGIVAESGPAVQEVRAGRRVLNPGSPMNPPSSAFADIAEGRTPRVEPAAAAVMEQPTARTAADPREPALGRAPAAGPVSERPGYAIPLSLEDPRRQQRSAEARRNPARAALLCAAAVLLMVAMAGGFVFWSGNKEVWEEEKRIGEMVEAEKWREIHTALATNGLNSKKLGEWEEIARAIARYGEIAENPQQFVTIVSGSDTVDEAIKTIGKEWEEAKIASSETLREKVEDAGNAANDSAETWSKAVEKVRSGSKGLRNELKKYSDPAQEPVRKHAEVLARSLEMVEAECATWDLGSLESADTTLAMVRDSILPEFSLLADIDQKYSMDADLKEPAGLASKSSERLAGDSRKLEAKGGGDEKFRKEVSGVCTELIARLGKLSDVRGFAREEPLSAPQTPAPPKPDPAVTAAAEAKKEKVPPKTILVRPGSDGLIDLSRIDGAPSDLPETVEIFPLSSLVPIDGTEGQHSTRSGSRGSYSYYDNKKKVILRDRGELKLKKEVNAEFWGSFPGGFILHFPKDGEGGDDVRYLVLDAIPVDQGSTVSSPFTTMPCSSFLNRLASGEVALSEDVARVLAKTQLAGGGSLKYRLTLAVTPAKEFTLEPDWDSDPSKITLRAVKKVGETLAKIHENKNLQAQAADGSKSIESKYVNLGRELFPQFFEEAAPAVVSKVEKAKIDKKNPTGGLPPKVHGTFSDFSKQTGLQLGRLPQYMDYVKSLFAALEALSVESQEYKDAHQHIEEFIENAGKVQAVNKLPKEAVAWYQLTRAWQPKQDTQNPQSISSNKGGQTDPPETLIQKKYFDDFFRVWNERFSEEAVTKLIADLNLIESTQALLSLEHLDSKLKTLEATKSRLENNDLTDDGDYTLELVIETPNPNSPTPSRQIIPLIRGAR
jgi:hypothetical protein